jgi:hypothetical protein
VSNVADNAPAAALATFLKETGLNVTGLRQRGTDRNTATFELVVDGDQAVPVGTIDHFWNYDKFCQACIVHTQRAPLVPDPENPMKPKRIKQGDWKFYVLMLIQHVAAVEAVEDERFEAGLIDWLDRYGKRASTDRDGALGSRDPFRDEDSLYVHAGAMAGWLRRSEGEQVTRTEVLRGLRAIGGERAKFNHGQGSRRTTVSYYRIDLTIMDGGV